MSGPSAPIIRPAAAPDLGAVRALLEETWHVTYDHLLGRDKVTDITSRWHAEEVLAAEIGRAGQVFLVAETDGQITGTASAACSDLGELDLRRIYVLPAYQGRGIGHALFEASLAAFPQAQSVHLEVEPNNTPAIAFYRRAGFEAVAKGTNCGGDAEAAVEHLIMRKSLLSRR